MNDYKLHPLVEQDTPYDAADFTKLVNSIREKGQLEPCWVWQGQIIDGGNRFRACQELGVEVRVVEIDAETEDQAIELAEHHNDIRRHRTPEDRKFRAAEIAKYLDKLPPRPQNDRKSAVNGDRRQNNAAARASTIMGVSQRGVEQALRVMEKAPHLVPKVKSGEMSLHAAEREVKARSAPTAQVVIDSTPRDAIGVRLPNKNIEAVFVEAGAFNEAAATLRLLKKSLQNAIENSPAALYMRAQTVEIELQNVIEHLTQSVPYAVCPYCGGEGTDKHCQGKGWVSKLVFSQAPETMRRAMEARAKKEKAGA